MHPLQRELHCQLRAWSRADSPLGLSWVGLCLQPDWPTYFHFADIDRIAAFQLDMLCRAGVTEPHRWPQAMMAATEQGWPVHATHGLSSV